MTAVAATPVFIIPRSVVRAHPSPQMPARRGAHDGALLALDGRMPTLVDWTFAPDWLTPAQAAQLMGPAYSEAGILALVDLGAVDTKAGPVLLIDKLSLYEYRDALWEVLTYEQ